MSYESDSDFAEWDDDELPDETEHDWQNPESDADRVELLRIALNFQKSWITNNISATDLEELEAILKKHYRH